MSPRIDQIEGILTPKLIRCLHIHSDREFHNVADWVGFHVGLAQSHMDNRWVFTGSEPPKLLTSMIGAFDSCVHMSEEAANATKAVVSSHHISL